MDARGRSPFGHMISRGLAKAGSKYVGGESN
jgi:hypothetical protein